MATDLDLRPIEYKTVRGSFEGWFHGWDRAMQAVIEVPNGDVVVLPVGGDNQLIFKDRQVELVDKKKQEAEDKAAFEAQKAKAEKKTEKVKV